MMVAGASHASGAGGAVAPRSRWPAIDTVAFADGHPYRARRGRLLIRPALAGETRSRPVGHDAVLMPGDALEAPERFL